MAHSCLKNTIERSINLDEAPTFKNNDFFKLETAGYMSLLVTKQ